MDYEKMWKRLNQEVNFLIQQDVATIDPILLKGYMSFIEQIVLLEEMNASLEGKILP